MLRSHLLFIALMTVAISGCGDSAEDAKGSADNSAADPAATQPSDAAGPVPAMDIWTAASSGNVEVVEQHIASGLDLESTLDAPGIPGHGGTPLQLAAVSGQKEVVTLLISKGAKIETPAQDPFKGVALHWAAVGGQLEIAQLLVEAGADVNAKDVNGATPLDALAVNQGMDAATRAGFVKLLHSKGGVSGLAAAGTLPPPDPNKSIWDAVGAGDLEAIGRHLDEGADINGLVPAGFPIAGATPLHVAIVTDQGKAAEFLRDKGADINAQAGDVNGGRPLHWAVAFGKYGFVVGLLEAGAEINAVDKNGFTPLDALNVDPTGGSLAANPAVQAAKAKIANLLTERGALTKDELE